MRLKSGKKLFKDYPQVISPIVKNKDLQVAEKYSTHSIEEQHEKGTMKGDTGGMPCVLYNNLTIDWQGRYLQCCTFYNPTIGTMEPSIEKPADEMWEERPSKLFEQSHL